MKKLLFTLSFAIAISAMAISSYAEPHTDDPGTGHWRQDGKGWRYEFDDGSYYAGCWFIAFDSKWYYAKGDGYIITNDWFQDYDYKWYYFNGSGCMVANRWIGDYYLGFDGAMLTSTTTPDGYQVDYNGKWIRSGTNSSNVNNGTYNFFFENNGADFFSISGNTISINADMYGYYDEQYIGHKSVSYTLTSNTRYKTKFKLAPAVDCTKQDFINFYDTNESMSLDLTVQNGAVTEIRLVKLR